MTEDEFKPTIRAWFASNGFGVVDVPCGNQRKTPDFHMSKGAETYLLELKIKGDDEDELARDSEVIARGQILERSVPLSPRNTLDGIIRDGHEQMEIADPSVCCFHVLWIHCVGRDQHVLEERFRFTLFGQQRLISLEHKEQIHALYFRNSAFWRHRRGLDGVFLSLFVGTKLEVKLCINTLSNRLEAFRTSELFALHRDGLYDPQALERDCGAFLVDSDVDRKDESAVLDFLREKYSVKHLQTFAMGAHSLFALGPSGYSPDTFG